MKFLLFLILMPIFSSCVSSESKEPVVTDPSFEGIDPDRKALPKDGANPSQAVVNGSESNASAETPAAPAAPEQDVPGSDSTAVVPPTPSVDQVIPGESANQSAPEQPSVSDSGPNLGSGPQTRYVKAFELNIRSKPNRRSQIVGRLKGKEEVHVSIHGGWSKLDDGRWVRTRWLVKSPPEKLVTIPPDEEGRPSRKKRSRHSPASKRLKRGSKS